MGAPFFRTSPWTERIEFAHFEEGWQVSFEKTWSLVKPMTKTEDPCTLR